MAPTRARDWRAPRVAEVYPSPRERRPFATWSSAFSPRCRKVDFEPDVTPSMPFERHLADRGAVEKSSAGTAHLRPGTPLACRVGRSTAVWKPARTADSQRTA